MFFLLIEGLLCEGKEERELFIAWKNVLKFLN